MVGLSLLPGRETPFTDFRVEERDGLPSAVFDGLPAEQGSLLSYFLYPDKAYAGALYMDVLKVADGSAQWMSYEDDFFRATFRPDGVDLETKEPPAGAGTHAKVTLSTDDAKYLLLKWGVVCARRERDEEDECDVEAQPDGVGVERPTEAGGPGGEAL